ncbi:MAG: thiamine phosphate synthase [Polaromonas sp.]
MREKNLGRREFLAQALMLKKLLAPHGVPLLINDWIDIALACGAEGVHLGQSDFPVENARRLLPSEAFIGCSVESMSEVRQSATMQVDYLGVSPILATPTKTDTKNVGYVTVKCGNLRLHRRSDDFFPYGGLNIHN